MKDNRLEQRIQHSLNAELSGLNTTSWQRNQFFENATGGTKVKRKVSVVGILIAALMLITITAFALTNGFGILEYHPDQSANQAYVDNIMTLNQTWDGKYFSATIHEAVFDGMKMTFTMSISPKENADPVFVIPTGEPMKVTIVYDVETYDPNLAYYLSDGSTPGSTIENTITKTINSFGFVEAGKRYQLALHLGMRTVDFEASVTDWVDKNAEADLPYNRPTFVAGSTTEITLGSEATTYQFAISGLTPGATVTSAGGASVLTANASGISTGGISISENMGVTETSNTYTIVFSDGSTTIIKITQKAHALGMTATALAATGNEITLSAGTGVTGATFTYDNITNTGANPENIKVVRIRSGASTPLTHNATTSVGANEYNLAAGVLTISPAISGDVYNITIKMEDAEAETVTVTVP